MKKITSLSLGFSFLIMTYTGIMLFLSPHGRVAYWSDWHMLGLTKTEYTNIHTTSMLTFLFFGLLHIYYNWKPLVSYLKDRHKKISFTKEEFVIALGINLFFVVGTLTMMQPLKSFLDFGEDIKADWIAQYGEPPYGHAEETKLKVFCQKMDIDLEQAKKMLAQNHIQFEENDALKTIAQQNATTPKYIYDLIKQKESIHKDSSIPTTLGKRTLGYLSDEGKIDLDTALKILKSKGINDATEGSRVKNLADELDITPYELYQMIKK